MLPVLVGWTHAYAPLGTPLVDREGPAAVIAAWLDHLASHPHLPSLVLLPYFPVQGPIADDGAPFVVEIEHWNEAEVDAVGGELASDACTNPFGFLGCRSRVAIPASPKLAHRRQRRETLPKALYAPTLVIDADERRRIAQSADRRGQRIELRRRGVVASEQDHAADQRMADAFAILGGKLEARDVEHQRTAREGRHSGLLAARGTAAARARGAHGGAAARARAAHTASSSGYPARGG